LVGRSRQETVPVPGGVLCEWVLWLLSSLTIVGGGTIAGRSSGRSGSPNELTPELEPWSE